MRRIIHFLLLLLGVVSTELYAQKRVLLLHDEKGKFDFEPGDENMARRLTKLARRNQDSLVYYQLVQQLRLSGFPAVAIDSVIKQNKDTLEIRLFRGEQVRWEEIRLEEKSKAFFLLASPEFSSLTGEVFSSSRMAILSEKALDYLEEHGFPFARISVDSFSIINGRSTALLKLEKGPLIMLDSVEVQGKSGVNISFLTAYLSLKKGMLYKESVFNQMEKRLEDLPFIRVQASPQLVFYREKLKVIIHLEPRKAGQMDGMIGFLPDNNTGKILFTGQAHLRLHNQFGLGEMLDINWRKLQVRTQDLKLMYQHPYLLGSPFGAELQFKLYRRDTSFIDLQPNAAIQYLFQGNNYVKLFHQHRTSRMLSVSSAQILRGPEDLADLRSNLFGLGFRIERLDYRLNPGKGYRLLLSIASGQREIVKNPLIKEEFYQKMELKTLQWTGELQADWYLPLLGRSLAAFLFKGATVQSSNLFLNEAYRLGGIQNLRGVDEESLFASSYGVFSTELRYRFEKKSYLFLFNDLAWYENRVKGFEREDFPVGLGTGLTFETKAGIFSLTYALGRQDQIPFSFRFAKIHFGLVSNF